MQSNLSFLSGGGWDTTEVLNHGQHIACRYIYLKLETFDGEDGDGGIDEGGRLTGVFRCIAPGNDPNQLDGPLEEYGIFPGSIEFNISGKPTFRVELRDPELNFLDIRVFLDGFEITGDIDHMEIEIDAINDVVTGWVKYVSQRILDIAEVETVYLF